MGSESADDTTAYLTSTGLPRLMSLPEGLFGGLGALTSIEIGGCRKLKPPVGFIEGLEAKGVEVKRTPEAPTRGRGGCP